MIHNLRRRLTLAHVMAALAVFVALGGSAYSAAKIGSREIAKHAIGSRHIMEGKLKNKVVEDETLTGAKIDESTLENGARAYALVDGTKCAQPTGPCPVEESKGISSVTRDDTGLYCVIAPGINAEETPAAVTVDEAGTTGHGGNASATTHETDGCPVVTGGEGFVVFTQRQPVIRVNQATGTEDARVLGPADQANDVAFTIVIP
jgi:hypothetical protein